MAKVRERFWVDKLRKMVKSTIHQCHLCKRYHSKAFIKTGSADLPVFRTVPTRVFDAVGIDFAGPFEFKIAKGEYGKAYLALYTCSTSRAVHLDLVQNMEAETFKRSLKEFFARPGNPTTIISDNAKTFKSVATWLEQLKENAEINTWLGELNITWKFNLSRSPWWGGFFERMVGISKKVLYKLLGRSRITFEQMKEIFIEAEVIVNNRPLCYMEDDIQLPVLTPNMIIHGTSITLPEECVDDDPPYGQHAVQRLYQHQERLKIALWKRWKTEYLAALRERHQCSKKTPPNISIGDVVQLKEDTKNRGEWRIGIVTKLVKVNNMILGAKVKTGNKVLERPIQFLYPLELHIQDDEQKSRNDDVQNENESRRHLNDKDELKQEEIRYQRPERKAKKRAINKIKEFTNELREDTNYF